MVRKFLAMLETICQC